jgi:hypothetical protein
VEWEAGAVGEGMDSGVKSKDDEAGDGSSGRSGDTTGSFGFTSVVRASSGGSGHVRSR